MQRRRKAGLDAEPNATCSPSSIGTAWAMPGITASTLESAATSVAGSVRSARRSCAGARGTMTMRRVPSAAISSDTAELKPSPIPARMIRAATPTASPPMVSRLRKGLARSAPIALAMWVCSIMRGSPSEGRRVQ
jgi:hypothetical protein